MTSVSVRPRRRKLTRTALSMTVAGALVLGAVGFPLPALAASPDRCITLWHTVGFVTQTQYGRNDCSSGVYGFQVHNWSRISSETSPCLYVSPGNTASWKWTRGRGNVEVFGC